MTLIYRIQFSAGAEKLMFETIRNFATVSDIKKIIRENFKIYNVGLAVYDEDENRISDNARVFNGRRYVVPLKTV